MARPISKYFTPVIKKIIDAKKAENIVVDRQFKAVLRAEMLERAALSSGRSGSRRFDADGMSEAVSGFFRKWRYQLALVPVALVMVLVAAQTFKMPVALKSDVVVPVSAPVSVPVSQESVVAAESANGQVEQNAEQGTGGIKTFPGRMVLPADYFQKKQLEELPIAAPAIVSGGDSEVSIPAAAPIEGSEDSGKMVVAGTSIEPAGNGETFVTVPPIINTFVNRTVPQVSTQSDHVKKPGTAAGDLPDEMLGGSGETKISSPTAVTPVVPEAAQTSGTEQKLLQSRPVVEQAQVLGRDNYNLNDSLPAPAISPNTVRLVEVPTAVVEAPVVPIYYDPSFADSEKPEFERNILAGLMDGKDVSMISISKGADRVVTVELYLKDGTIDKKLFLRNTTKGLWNEVKYVQRYFFDDSLRYDVSYPFRMDTVNPFQYSNLNR